MDVDDAAARENRGNMNSYCAAPSIDDRTLRETLLQRMQTAGLRLSEVYVTQEHVRSFLAIKRALEDTSPHLLVMGTSRNPVFKRLLSNSVATEVLRKIECDALIASPAAAQQAG
jgi:nucleotide-binding universal stress UspA family protein